MSFTFELPDDYIAKFPVKPRDTSKLMVLDKNNGNIQHHNFYNLINFLQEGDALIFNNVKVEPRRVTLYLKDKPNQIFEFLFIERSLPKKWKVLVRKQKKIKDGDILIATKNEKYTFKVFKTDEIFFLEETTNLNENDFIAIGEMPIPPYFNRKATQEDMIDYQSIFATQPGAIAAPTASLHFTDNIFKQLKSKNITTHFITLYVGYGTFAPLTKENFSQNKLHEEKYNISESVAKFLQEKKYKRLICVGTTTLRVLETVYNKTNGQYNNHLSGTTDIFLYPPYKIKSIDGLITNFHLSQSSLLLLTACMLPEKYLEHAYQQAMQNKYRFYSYGDAMLIL